MFKYSTSGTDGQAGSNGEDGLAGAAGGGAGTDAVAGVNGQNGTSAQPNTVCLMSVPGQRIFVVSPKANDVDATILPLYDGSVRVDLYAMGGKGGDGGKGGKGTYFSLFDTCCNRECIYLYNEVRECIYLYVKYVILEINVI
jgi:hypothetical protein